MARKILEDNLENEQIEDNQALEVHEMVVNSTDELTNQEQRYIYLGPSIETLGLSRTLIADKLHFEQYIKVYPQIEQLVFTIDEYASVIKNFKDNTSVEYKNYNDLLKTIGDK